MGGRDSKLPLLYPTTRCSKARLCFVLHLNTITRGAKLDGSLVTTAQGYFLREKSALRCVYLRIETIRSQGQVTRGDPSARYSAAGNQPKQNRFTLSLVFAMRSLYRKFHQNGILSGRKKEAFEHIVIIRTTTFPIFSQRKSEKTGEIQRALDLHLSFGKHKNGEGERVGQSGMDSIR